MVSMVNSVFFLAENTNLLHFRAVFAVHAYLECTTQGRRSLATKLAPGLVGPECLNHCDFVLNEL